MKTNQTWRPTTPQPFHIPCNRRRFFKSMAVASAGFTLPGFLAEALTLSPIVTPGPFYPLADDIPLDKDNDLVQLNDSLTPAAGIVTHLSGRVLTSTGVPVRDALVELWHTDREGDYLYSAGVGRNPSCDSNFAGFGQFLTGSTGQFRFRTIKAGLYTGRTRHYHVGVTVPGRTTRSTTQTFWNEPTRDLNGILWPQQNDTDMIWAGIADPLARASVTLDYTAVPETTTGEVQATWDFVSGFTPVEPTYPGGALVIAGLVVPGPVGGNPRYKITVPAYASYTYEVYGNPTMAALGWRALPFALTQTGAIDRHKHTANANASLSFFVERKAVKGFYLVSFRIPGANTGTP